MKGFLFALGAGAFITLQGVANTQISGAIGTWQAATLTQLTGFIVALLIVLTIRQQNIKGLRQAKPLYLAGGGLGALVIIGNVTAIQHVGVTLTSSILLIAQLGLTFLIDSKGWFGFAKQRMRLPQFIGIGLMIAGVVVLGL